MPPFDDYHRTIIGYHGTRLSATLDVVNRRADLRPSDGPDEWLGRGVYFWEYGPQQALDWAERRRRDEGWDEPVAVLASMIRLGSCLDLLDPQNVEWLATMHERFVRDCIASGKTVPKNVLARKWLDCAVLESAVRALDSRPDVRPIDTIRAVYAPSRSRDRAYPTSWISRGAHVQIAVRNRRNILGTWLQNPIG